MNAIRLSSSRVLSRSAAKSGETALTVNGQVVYITAAGSRESNVVLDAPSFRPLARASAYAQRPVVTTGTLVDIFI